MHAQRIQKILSTLDKPVTDPGFFAHVFKAVAKIRKHAQAQDVDELKQACTEEYEEISQRLDDTKIQESCSVRNVLQTRRIAQLLINDEGDFNSALLPRVIQLLTENLYVLGPQRQYDGPRHEHMLRVLTLLNTTPELARLIKRIGKPHQHPLADQIIRDTLQLPASIAVTDAHARRATLAAWMCTLRQNIGSCFATAPAIIIHDEQPEQFLLDIYDMLGTGRLKRTFGGIEYTVPLSTSWGGGDLRKPILLIRNSQNGSAIWNAPGLIAALESVDLLNAEASIKNKIEITKSLVLEVLPEWTAQQPYLVTSSEEILRRILMHHYQLTPQDIHDYENRPRGMVHTSLLMQSTPVGLGGKSEACAIFLTQFQNAMNAFKLLADNALLKTWEFTIASFSEIKSEFGRWNLYSSLGLRPEEPGGIGQCLYEHIKRKLDHSNQQVQDYQFDYEHMFAQVKQLESRMRNAASEKEAQWIRVEFQSKSSEFYLLEELRNKAHARAEALSQLLNIFVDGYDRLFPEYFQEVYDADMHEVNVGPYDDSPAGFRLLYKHGRNNTAQWMRIKTPQEFVEALANFFTSTEREIASLDVLQGMETDVSDIVTAIVNHVRTQEFLETAFHRMAAAYHRPALKNPLEHLDKIDKKPWAYTSGGAITTLISSYYRHEEKPKEVARWVENPMELFVFFVDTLKQIPYKMMEEYLNNPKKSMLMHSPTHAFNLKPGSIPFKEAWQTEAFTYTWLRDNLTQPMERFVNFISLDEEQMDFIIHCFLEKIPHDFHHYFRKTFSRVFGPMDTSEFRNHMLDAIAYERGLQLDGRGVLTADDIDSAFYSWLPLCSYHQISKRVEAIFAMIPEITADKQKLLKEVIDSLTERTGRGYITAQQLQDICLALLCLADEKTASSQNFPAKVAHAAQSLGFAMPAPIIFADTNWVKDMFGFVVNPGTQELEFWRVDMIGRVGTPMSIWKQWLNGSHKEALWGVFTNPNEYSFQARHPKGMLI
jgi:hypothetical protein